MGSKVSKYIFPKVWGGKWSYYQHENNSYERWIKNSPEAIIAIFTSTTLPSTILISTLTLTSTSALTEKHNKECAYIPVTKNTPELVSN